MAFLLAAAVLLLATVAEAGTKGTPSEYGPVIEKTFYSRAFTLSQGQVIKEWVDIPFVEGHVGLRNFNAELVDEDYNPVPLNEVYLHHWTVKSFGPGESTRPWDGGVPGDSNTTEEKLMLPRGMALPHGAALGEESANALSAANKLDPEAWKNYCEKGILADTGAWFGVGSETRHTNTTFPAPYAVEVGNPTWEPKQWKAQIHAIDTRETVDPWGCLECLCSVYDTNGIDEYGRTIPANYTGGYSCCFSGKTCKLTAAAAAAPPVFKTRYLKYTIQYVPWDECVIPVRIYFLDVTVCKGEYDVPACEAHTSVTSCVHKMDRKLTFPKAGYLVQAEGHQHYGAMGISLARQNGSIICDSLPRFGRGEPTEAGNEAGYLTGMGVCEFANQEARIHANETVTMESVYSRLGGHTGVMGQFVIGVHVDGDYQAPAGNVCLGPGRKLEATSDQNTNGLYLTYHTLAALLIAGPTLVVVISVVVYTLYVVKMRHAADSGDFTPLAAGSA